MARKDSRTDASVGKHDRATGTWVRNSHQCLVHTTALLIAYKYKWHGVLLRSFQLPSGLRRTPTTTHRLSIQRTMTEQPSGPVSQFLAQWRAIQGLGGTLTGLFYGHE